MSNVYTALISLFVLMLPAVDAAPAQSNAKMYCWKNKAGKTECGDKVPYENQDSAIRELNKQGVVTTREALTPEERKRREILEEDSRAGLATKLEQRRQDRALLATFANEKEIDLKRNRDVQLLESNIEILQSNLSNISERLAYAHKRSEQYTKDKRLVSQHVLDDIERASADKALTERQIALKRIEIRVLHQHYNEVKKRFAELTSGTPGNAGLISTHESKVR